VPNAAPASYSVRWSGRERGRTAERTSSVARRRQLSTPEQATVAARQAIGESPPTSQGGSSTRNGEPVDLHFREMGGVRSLESRMSKG